MKLIALCAALFLCSCTDAQWRHFQEVTTQVASYVNDAILSIGMVKDFVERAVPAQDRETVSDVFDAIRSCNEALQAEADAVSHSRSAVDSSAHLASSFPRFISSWSHLEETLRQHHLVGGERRMAARVTFTTPRIVRDAGGSR